MKKIRLNVEELEVRSFVTDDAPGPRGTVHGRGYTQGGEQSCYQACFPMSYEFDTCGQTGPTCGASCDWVCDHSYAVCPSDTGGCD